MRSARHAALMVVLGFLLLIPAKEATAPDRNAHLSPPQARSRHEPEASYRTRSKQLHDNDTICAPQNTTYSNEQMPPGSYMPWGLMLPVARATSSKYYITIVNLTPHRFVLGHTHAYQLPVFDFGDVPPGRARQNTVVYSRRPTDNPVDSGGEAHFSLSGAGAGGGSFTVRAATHIPDGLPQRTVVDLAGLGLGRREYRDPAPEAAVTLVITGSAAAGFASSLAPGPAGWMRGLRPVLRARRLRHLVMPGTHDSGMSRVSGRIASLGTARNTQTQALDIYGQLRAGARWFDLRVASVHGLGGGYGFWTLHVNEETAEVAVGNSGEALDEVVQELNRFTAEDPGEVIFLRVKYLVGIREVPSGGPIYWDEEIVQAFLDKLRRVNYRCGGLDTSVGFQEQTAGYFMDQNGGAGCVIFLLDGRLQGNVTRESPTDGIYEVGRMGFWDDWSNQGDTRAMAEDQAAGWGTLERGGDPANDKFMIAQWLLTTDAITATAYGLEALAVLPTNPALYWMGLNRMSPKSWPNVLMVDYLGVVVEGEASWDQLGAEMYALAVGLNWYMVSENCRISPRPSSPLAGLAAFGGEPLRGDLALPQGKEGVVALS